MTEFTFSYVSVDLISSTGLHIRKWEGNFIKIKNNKKENYFIGRSDHKLRAFSLVLKSSISLLKIRFITQHL